MIHATKDVSAESSAATDVIILVIGIKRALDKRHGAADNEKRNNQWHEHQVRRRSSATTVATLVDPRYRGKLFSQSEFATAKQWLVDAVHAVHCWIQLQRVQLQRATTTTAPQS